MASMFGAWLVGWGAALTVSGAAAAIVAQVPAEPIPLDQRATRDNLQVLTGGQAAHDGGMEVLVPSPVAKYHWIVNAQPGPQFLEWTLAVPAAAAYRVTALVRADVGQRFRLSVNGGGAGEFAANGAWERTAPVTVKLPAGRVVLRLSWDDARAKSIELKSLELLRQSDLAAYEARVAAARKDTAWFAQSPYGLFFQYGSWGYPNNVGDRKNLDRQAADFDVPSFVQKVVDSGAGHVIWSVSWWGYRMNAPLRSVDAIVRAAGGAADPGFASKRDLIAEVASALKAKGIRFAIYYHTGTEEAAWWEHQKYPAKLFTATGTGERSVFFANWRRVVSEIGERYGKQLDAFFFDDGLIYYPAPFEDLQRAARAGNPDRLISWNSWVLPRYTDFQDVFFGEDSHGEVIPGSAPPGGNGVFVSGPQQGLLQQGMFRMDDDWGVHTRGGGVAKTDTEHLSSQALIRWAADARARRAPLSLTLMMYEDGSVLDNDLRILHDLRQSLHCSLPALPTGTVLVNDDAAAIRYDGAWSRQSRPGVGLLQDDLHVADAAGASFTHAFSGTGVEVLVPPSKAASRVAVTLDGEAIGEFGACVGATTAQQVLYSARHLQPGTHTITLRLLGGAPLQLDALRIVPDPVTIGESAATRDGDSLTLPFTGTGIELIGPMNSASGSAEVFIDGRRIASVRADSAGPPAMRQRLWGISHLTPGPHTLRLTKSDDKAFQVDAFRVWP